MSDPASSPLPVRRDWFAFRDVGEGITHVEEPAVHPFLRSNLWYVAGQRHALLVDAGMGLADLPQALAVRDLPEPCLWVTHGHLDHMGGAHGFRHVWSHVAEADAMRAPEADSIVTAELPPSFREALAAGEPNGVAPEFLVDSIPAAGFLPSDYELLPAPPTQVWKDGDRIDLGDRCLEVVHLPGHTPGSAGLLDRDTGTLFSGDVVYDGELLDELPESDIPAYVASMRRLLTLPVRLVHAGHEPSFDGDRLLTLCEEYLARRG